LIHTCLSFPYQKDFELSGRVSLTFDDALGSHLDQVVPILNKAGFQGTFYVHLSSVNFITRQREWRQAALDGHELGNHTVFHPADERKSWVRPGNAINYYTIERMRMELSYANSVLNALDGANDRSFAYPCCNSFVGHHGWVRSAIDRAGLGRTRIAAWVDRGNLDWGSTRHCYESIVGELCLAGRGGGLTIGQAIPTTSTWRRTNLLSAAVDNPTLADLQSHVEWAMANDRWAILQFHGIGGDHHMNCPLAVFHDLVTWLKLAYADRVTTVRDGARHQWDSMKDTTHLAEPNSVAAEDLVNR